MFEIRGKVALITGGAKGIGLSFAKELLKNGLKGVSLIDVDSIHGATVASQLCNEYGANAAIFVKADVTNDTEFEDAFNTTVRTFKQLDIVINNAGIVQEIQWRKCMEVNLMATITGSILAMEKYLPNYKSGDEGVLVNMASVLGYQPIEATPIYASTKSGIIGYSRSIGGPVHYEKYKVRVLTICPGATNTTMLGLTEEQQHEPFASLMNSHVNDIQMQKSEEVAHNLIPIIQEGLTGSVWNIVKGCRSLTEFPTIGE